MLDGAFRYIFSILYFYLLVVGNITHFLLPTIHHFRVGQSSGFWGLIKLGQVLLRN